MLLFISSLTSISSLIDAHFRAFCTHAIIGIKHPVASSLTHTTKGQNICKQTLLAITMSVIRNTYSASTSIQPYYVRIQKNTAEQESVIISDDGPINMEVNDQTIVWLKVETDCQITVLVNQPSNITAFTPAHANFDKTRILVKAAETFVIEHSSVIMSTSNQTAVTGYQQGVFDIIYIKIDHSSNTTTIYA